MNESYEKSSSSTACSTPVAGATLPECYDVSDTFYTSQRKGRKYVFRVRLDINGFTLQRESPSGTIVKEQTVKLCDIVGARCMRLKKTRRLAVASACACSAGNPNSPAASVNRSGATPSKCSTASKEDFTCDGDVSAYLYVFAYVLKKKSLRSEFHRERTVLTLRFRSFDTFEDNMREADRWYRALRWQLHRTLESIFVVRNEEDRRRRILVMLNPKSGSGNAREVFNMHVTPVLNEAEVPYDLYVTKHSNFAIEFMSTRCLDAWCCVVAVGGDGLFHEIVNGLLQREDWAKVLPSIALGIIPCGSGNGLARSIAHGYNEPYFSKPVLGAALTVISGCSSPMDVVRVQLQNRSLYSFLSIGWGFISDVDIESERIRVLGYQRFTIWTLYRLANLRTYNGKISYLLTEPEENAQHTPELKMQTSRSCNTHIDKLSTTNNNPSFHHSTEYLPHEFADVISLETSINQSFRSRCDSWLSGGSRRSYYYSVSESIYHSLADDSDFAAQAAISLENRQQNFGPTSSLPELDEPLPEDEGWLVEEGEFIMMHAVYQSHLGIDCHFAPKAQMNDGTIYLILIRGGISRPQLLSFLYNMSTGTHLPEVNNEYVKVLPVRAFRLEPHDNHGIITIDGERVEFGPLQAEVLPGIARVMVPK
ncbi:sphingosine kinase 2 [Drosophila guanche]|uniref:sphingosine kinase n=1 Tax=Drosophila guanche TaxID=7266 RepID=A0A3B0J5A4_DROGU|nr:sphingosine kinase 2 [Drosophila guanche]SPP77124.1 blast:Sphingosine kinase 2 [Drosophila guanche]